MPPTTLQKPKETIAQTYAKGQAAIAGFSKPKTGFTVPMPDTVPSEALNGNFSIPDVRASRDGREQADMATAQIGTDYTNLNERISNLKPSPLTNPDETINRILANQPTEVGNALDAGYSAAAQRYNDFGTAYSEAGSQARKDLNVTGIQSELSQTNKDIADETLRLRQVMRDFETNAERRGVAREFIDAEKLNIKTKSAELLADLNITRLAQQGDLTLANAEVDRILAEKEKAFGFETKGIEAEISRLEKLDTKEADARKDELTVALAERANNVAKALANEKESRGYYVDAVNNGADKATRDTMRNMIANGVDPAEVAFAGSEYIGRLDRMQAQANLANTYSQIDSRNLNDLITKAEKGDPDAIAKLKFDPKKTTGNFEAETGLRKEFNGLKVVQDATQVQNSFNQINSAYTQALSATDDKTSKATADQALVISFNKMLDPGSVVREGEFARSTEGQSLINQYKGKVEKIAQGGVGLTDEDRASIVNLTRVLYADYIKTHNDKAYEFRQNAVRQGGDPSYVASYMDTMGLSAQSAQEGDIIIKNGQPYEKQGDQMVPLDI